MRKRKQNVTNGLIYERFAKNRKNGGIVAYFISSEPKTEANGNESVSTSIQYFDKDSLGKLVHIISKFSIEHSLIVLINKEQFLNDSRKDCSGILQRFVVSRGTENSMFCSIWSPNVCLIERRTNNNQLKDKRHVPDIHERVVTFEGPEMYSTSTTLHGTALTGSIQDSCENIVNHVICTSEDEIHIKRMVAMFKVDKRNRVWFLWSTSIRLGGAHDDIFLNRKPKRLLDPLDIEARYDLNSSVKLCPLTSFKPDMNDSIPRKQCISCLKHISKFDDLYPVPYKTIIAHFEQVIGLVKSDIESERYIKWPPNEYIIKAGGNVGFGCVRNSKEKLSKQAETVDLVIPPIIRKLHTRLRLTGYYRYRDDPLFLHRTCSVCENCFLSYANLVETKFYIVSPVIVDENQRHKQRLNHEQKPTDRVAVLQDKQNQSKWAPIKCDSNNKKAVEEKTNSLHERRLSFVFSNAPQFPNAITADNLEETSRNNTRSMDEKVNHLYIYFHFMCVDLIIYLAFESNNK